MRYQIDELLKEDKYDIYNNPNISNENIDKIANMFCSDKNVDFIKYFDLLKCSSKFCWIIFCAL